MKLSEMAFAKKTYRTRMPRVNPPKEVEVWWPEEYGGEKQDLYPWHINDSTDTTLLSECLTDLAEHSHDMHELDKEYDTTCNMIVGALMTEGSPPMSKSYGEANSAEQYEKWGNYIAKWYRELLKRGSIHMLNDVNIMEVSIR